jgi:3-hydroxyacyl-CoA dehydrogenase
MAEIGEVAAVGAGTMGSQIAPKIACVGRHQVTLVDGASERP